MANFATFKLACLALLIGTSNGGNPFKKMFGTKVHDIPPHEATGMTSLSPRSIFDDQVYYISVNGCYSSRCL
jgi:hypothetical protein